MKFFKGIKKETLFSLLSIGVMFYAFTSISKAIFKNYEANTDLESLKTEVDSLKKENDLLKDKIEFYKTDVFKERQARAKLDLMKPGEKVIIIVDPKTESSKVEKETKKSDINLPNYHKWFKLWLE